MGKRAYSCLQCRPWSQLCHGDKKSKTKLPREGLEFIYEFQASVELERVSHLLKLAHLQGFWAMRCTIGFPILLGNVCSGWEGIGAYLVVQPVLLEVILSPVELKTPLFKPSPWFQVFHMFTSLLIPLSSMHVLIMQYMKLVKWNIHII